MRPILWVAVIALLFAAVGSQLRVTTCVGECCEVEAGVDTNVAANACCQVATEPVAACCGCCDEPGSDDSKSEPPIDDDTPPESPLGGCTPGCCLTMDFDIEMAPIDAPVELPLWFVLALPPTTPCFAPLPVREFERMRPFDRGPPRVDRSTALRVCTVLLI